MKYFLQQVLDSSETWALLIPLAFMLRYKSRFAYLKPVRMYVYIALLLNIVITIISKRNEWFNWPEETNPKWLGSNNFIYNIHSLLRLLLFSWFFILLNQKFLTHLKKTIPILFIFGAAINFIFLEDFFYYSSFSNRLLSIEATLLLFYCLLYYMYMLKDDESSFRESPSFWVVTGLSIYVVVNIPIFLFYTALLKEFRNFTVDIWDVHNFSYIIFCIFIAKAFYESKR